jgi:phytanoyl-CoA hydroxylase
MSSRLHSFFYREPPPRTTSEGTQYHSQFGGLWVDQLDAMHLLGRKAEHGQLQPALVDKLRFFILHGYVILENAVPHEKIDRYLADFQQATRQKGPVLASVPAMGPQDKGIVPLHRADVNAPLTKALDTYHHLESAHEIIFAERIQEFLLAVFQEDLLAFQGLHFEKGSTQAVHQDTAYVVLSDPMRLCASWVALEDVIPGSGELIYYPGSHRLPDWLYSGKYKHFNYKRDLHAEHMAHLESLHVRSKEQGLQLQSFLPKKGDALIWAADLAHGGSPITDPHRSRRSLVTHYTSGSTAPHYLRYLPFYRRKGRQVLPGCYCNSLYY